MWEYFNPNPDHKSVGDCTVRALAFVLGVSWHRAFEILVDEAWHQSDMPNSNAVMASVMKKKHYKRKIIPDTCPQCYTLRDFVKDHPKGRYLVAFGSHVVGVESGSYYDSWDSGSETPIYYFVKEED